MFCRSCGARLNDGARFCPKCGTPQDFVQPSGLSVPSASAVSPTPAKRQQGESVENTAARKGLIFGILALVSTLIMFLVYRRVLFPMTMSGMPISREIGPFVILILTDFFSLVMIILNGVFGIMGLVKGIISKNNLVLGIIAVVFLAVNVILFFVAAERVIALSNYVTNYWLGKLYW